MWSQLNRIPSRRRSDFILRGTCSRDAWTGGPSTNKQPSPTLFRSMNCFPMLKVGIVAWQPPHLWTNRAAHLFEEIALKFFLFVAPTPCGDHPSSISRLNVARMDFMSLRYCASGHIDIQFVFLNPQIPHCAIEILNRCALVSTAAVLEAPSTTPPDRSRGA